MSDSQSVRDGAGRRIKRIALSICFLLSGCRGAGFEASYSPGPDARDYGLREDCLYRTLCPEIARRGAKDLEGAAGYASSFCQEPITQIMMRQAGGQSNDEVAKQRMAQLEFDWHAMAVAQQLKDRCGASG